MHVNAHVRGAAAHPVESERPQPTPHTSATLRATPLLTRPVALVATGALLWPRQLAAAEADRRTLFGEAQGVEAAVRDEKARKAEAQSSASHYRNLLNSYM